MTTFVLVHGMFLGGWCWEPLAADLRARGHSVVAPDLPGCGEDNTPSGEVTLDLWAGAVAKLVKDAAEPVVLVGHSRGGLVIGAAAERAHERVAGLVYVTAVMPPAGRSVLDATMLSASQPSGASLPRLGPDGTSLVAPDDLLDQMSELSDAMKAWALPRVGPEPLGPLLTPLDITPERWGRLPRLYIEALRDEVLPIAMQRAIVATAPGTEVASLDAGHMLILSHAAELAKLLEGFATRTVKDPPAL